MKEFNATLESQKLIVDMQNDSIGHGGICHNSWTIPKSKFHTIINPQNITATNVVGVFESDFPNGSEIAMFRILRKQ